MQSYFKSFINNTFINNTTYDIENYVQNVSKIGDGNTFEKPVNIKSGIITENATWKKIGVDYIIDGPVEIKGTTGPILTLEPGTTLKFTTSGGLEIAYDENGGLNAVGSSTEKITFTSSASVPSKGGWKGIFFYENTTSSTMDYCIVEYAGGDWPNTNIRIESSNVTISNTIVRYSKEYGIYIDDTADPIINSVTYSDNTTDLFDEAP
ncbi:MAG: hypothetical protein ACOCWG_00880 [bacterium]